VLRVEIVAACGAPVAGRDHHCNALGCGLLPKRLEKLIPSRSEMLFAGAKTHANDTGKIVIDSVDGRKMDPRRRFRWGRGYEINRCAGGNGASPLNVQIGFDFASIQAWVGAIENDVLAGEILRQAKNCAEVDDILNLYVGFAEHCNGLACSRNSAAPKWRDVVDFCEIGRREREKLTAVSGGRVQRNYCSRFRFVK